MNGAAKVAITFDNAPAYERFMGDWSRAAGAVFLDWLAPECGIRWLEIGCGTGAFTALVHRRYVPSTMIAIDAAVDQISYCRQLPIAQRVQFRVADATALPFGDAGFDVIAHALVLNFVSDVQCALREMRRVGRKDGFVAGYVWDFGAARAPNSCIALALRKIGCAVPAIPGSEISSLYPLCSAFEQAGFHDVDAMSFDISMTFGDFDEFWRSQTPSFSPLAPIIKALSCADRRKLTDLVRAELPIPQDGRICSTARANAIKARVP
jgi:ubiquinone/menaquinone biosynthesis C-methylase UbiE